MQLWLYKVKDNSKVFTLAVRIRHGNKLYNNNNIYIRTVKKNKQAITTLMKNIFKTPTGGSTAE